MKWEQTRERLLAIDPDLQLAEHWSEPILSGYRTTPAGGGRVRGTGAGDRGHPIQRGAPAGGGGGAEDPGRRAAAGGDGAAGPAEQPGAYVKDLREAYEAHQRDGDVEALLVAVQTLETAAEQEQEAAPAEQLTREGLHLVCWEYVWS